jgi:amidohydrolase family protein
MRLRNLVSAIACLAVQSAHAAPVAIVHGTLIDVSHYGLGAADIDDATIVLRDGRIESAGAARAVTIPKDARIVDARGRFIVPGLIDGYGGMRTPGFAKAYLYDGVTSVYVAISNDFGDGENTGRVLRDTQPGPRLLRGAVMTGYSPNGDDVDPAAMAKHRTDDARLTDAQLRARIDTLAADGVRGVTISYDTWPDQIATIARAARAHAMAAVDEPGFANYPDAIQAGVAAFPHNDRYETELALASHWLTYSDGPGGMKLRDAYHDVCTADPSAPALTDYGTMLSKSRTALLPLLSIEATADGLDVPNPWSAKSSVLIRPGDLDNPVDPVTGAAPYLAQLPAERRTPVRDCAKHRQLIEARLHALGAHYLAGSGAPAYGIMPGSGLHGELALLVRIGLTPREALAAATSNFADVYGWTDIGRVEAGRDADLLILDADPRKAVSALDRIHMVLLNGTAVDRDRLLALPSKPPGA